MKWSNRFDFDRVSNWSSARRVVRRTERFSAFSDCFRRAEKFLGLDFQSRPNRKTRSDRLSVLRTSRKSVSLCSQVHRRNSLLWKTLRREFDDLLLRRFSEFQHRHEFGRATPRKSNFTDFSSFVDEENFNELRVLSKRLSTWSNLNFPSRIFRQCIVCLQRFLGVGDPTKINEKIRSIVTELNSKKLSNTLWRFAKFRLNNSMCLYFLSISQRYLCGSVPSSGNRVQQFLRAKTRWNELKRIIQSQRGRNVSGSCRITEKRSIRLLGNW